MWHLSFNGEIEIGTSTQKATTARYGVLGGTRKCRGTRHCEPGWLLTDSIVRRITTESRKSLFVEKS
jgi:hypothetical protein